MPKIFRVIFNFYQWIIIYFKIAERRVLIEYFITRYDFFWKKKKPIGEQYPFVIHDPFELFDEEGAIEYKKLYLIGDSWVEAPDKPIAVIIGCTDWKYGFIADYLPEYRTAFGSRKFVGIRMIKAIRKLSIKPEVAIIWGYTENFSLRMYLKYRNIPIWRMEDAFIRSASLGATHSTPYSLVIDKTGLYYNGKKPSDIRSLLNSYDFRQDLSLQINAKNLLDYLCENKISKYNPPIVCYNNGLKLRKTVLVIGQVDNDASLRYGNPDRWSMNDMVRLAKYENPEADILYRPHPEVYAGYQKSRFKSKGIEKFVKILSPDEHIIELLERVDHVYTLTSLTGLEALIRGKKVTVLGTPFYAGWGLTDDRCKFKDRTRNLTLLELFSIAYVIYPTYLLEKRGMKKAEAIQVTLHKLGGDISEIKYTNVITKDFEEMTYSQEYKVMSSLKHMNSIPLSDIREIFNFFSKYKIQDFIAPLLFNSIGEDKRFDYLVEIIEFVETDVYMQLLENINNQITADQKNQLIIQCLSSWSDKLDKTEVVEVFGQTSNIIRSNVKAYVENQFKSEDDKDLSGLEGGEQQSEENILSDFNQPSSAVEMLSESNARILSNELMIHMEYCELDKALEVIKKLLALPDQNNVILLNKAAEIYYKKFEIERSKGISLLSMMINVKLNNRKALLQYVESSYILNKYKMNTELFDLSFMSISTNPEFISKYRVIFGRENDHFDMLNHSIYLDKKFTIAKMMGFIENNDYKMAKKVFDEIYKDTKNMDKLVKVYTDFLCAEERIDDAIDVLNKYKKFNNSEQILRQLIKLYQFTGCFDKAEENYVVLEDNKYELNTVSKIPILLSKNEYKKAYEQHISENLTKKLTHLLGDKFRKANISEDIDFFNNSLILAVQGPGDEIRFSTIYMDLIDRFVNKKFTISCDVRLYPLFKRTFQNIDFLPVARTRAIDEDHPIENYNQLPSMELTWILDNYVYKKTEEFKTLYLVTDFISKVRAVKEDFGDQIQLIENKELSAYFEKELVPYKDNILVGVNWRSSLTSFSRMAHYLTIEEISRIFEIPNVTFINLQYDECDKELNWVEENYPGKLINFVEIDQFNDFESVSALMKNLDLVIAPATSVAELAGALGVPTWLFSTSSEIEWRKIDSVGTDIWRNSITIVDVPEKGNKKLLVEEINNRLLKFTKKVA